MARRTARRVGVMGGTFDPIHNGHLLAASEAAWRCSLDEVVFVPAGRPVFKLDRDVAPAEDRYAMVALAIADNPRFSLSRVDIDRVGVTYTVDTLRDLRAARPDDKLFFIAGTDAIAQASRWKDAEQLPKLARFIAVTRPGKTMSADSDTVAAANFTAATGPQALAGTATAASALPATPFGVPGSDVTSVPIPAFGVSSTMLRERVRRGLPIDYLTPAAVARYIAGHGLYRGCGTSPEVSR